MERGIDVEMPSSQARILSLERMLRVMFVRPRPHPRLETYPLLISMVMIVANVRLIYHSMLIGNVVYTVLCLLGQNQRNHPMMRRSIVSAVGML